MATISDGELMQKVAAGDKKAFATLFDRHSQRVLGYARRMLGNLQAAEEVSQEVWVRVVRAAPSYRDSGEFGAWLTVITRNMSLNHLRTHKQLDPVEDQENIADTGPSVEEIMSHTRDLEVFKAALDGLPDAQRTALVLQMVEELSYEEVAQTLNTTVSGVKSLLFRAKQNLIMQMGGRK